MTASTLKLIQTESGPVQCATVHAQAIHRVGYKPDPWQWTPWEYAYNGRFDGRWDDPDGVWRALYVGETALACYLEVLAPFRPDPTLADELAEIVSDAEDPAIPPGVLPVSWCSPRTVCAARMSGTFALPGHGETLPSLRHRFLALARNKFGLSDLDAAAIRDSRPRELTRAISAWIYTLCGPDGGPLSGIQFVSRHGDQHALWALYERDQGHPTPPQITHRAIEESVTPSDPTLLEAMRIHRISWPI